MKGEDGRNVDKSSVIQRVERVVTYNLFPLEKEGVGKVTNCVIHLNGTL